MLNNYTNYIYIDIKKHNHLYIFLKRLQFIFCYLNIGYFVYFCWSLCYFIFISCDDFLVSLKTTKKLSASRFNFFLKS